MAFDVLHALEKVHSAIGKLVLRGSIQTRVQNALTELHSPTFALLPEGEAKDLFDSIASARDLAHMADDEAETVAKQIVELRARLENIKMLAR